MRKFWSKWGTVVLMGVCAVCFGVLLVMDLIPAVSCEARVTVGEQDAGQPDGGDE